jgi:hypothetical protein
MGNLHLGPSISFTYLLSKCIFHVIHSPAFWNLVSSIEYVMKPI